MAASSHSNWSVPGQACDVGPDLLRQDTTHHSECRVVTTGDAQHRWWSCCWGHVFEHDPVAEDDELRCPAFVDDEEPCGTYFVFEPFASRQEAVDALKSGSPRPRWAPWAN